MKIRKLLTLLALLASAIVGHTEAEPTNNQVPSAVSASAPAASEASDLLTQLKERADPNYVARLKEQTGHDKRPVG